MKRRCLTKQSIPNAIYSKEFRELAKHVTVEGLGAKESAQRLPLPSLTLIKYLAA
ncbi:MAG: hypothetical protein ABIR84_13485 [Candidatus Nitrotoga sp.]